MTETTSPEVETKLRLLLVDDNSPFPQIVAEVDDEGSISAHIATPGRIVGTVSSTTKGSYYHADGLESLRLVTSPEGFSTDELEFSAFGEQTKGNLAERYPFNYAGERLEADIGLYYNRARWLYPEVGRFISSDAYLGEIEAPGTLNQYIYSLGDPVNRRDPSGFASFSVVSASVVASLTGLAAYGLGRAAISTHYRVYLSGPPSQSELASNSQVVEALEEAWRRSEPYPFDPSATHEEGGWIYMHPLTREITVRWAEPAEKGKEMDRSRPTGP